MKALLTTARILTLIVAIVSAFVSLAVTIALYSDVRRSDDDRNSYRPPLFAQERQRSIDTLPFVAAGIPIGLIGGILAVCGRLGNATVWLLVAGIGPALFGNSGAMCPCILLCLAAAISFVGFLIDVFNPPKLRPALAPHGGRHA